MILNREKVHRVADSVQIFDANGVQLDRVVEIDTETGEYTQLLWQESGTCRVKRAAQVPLQYVWGNCKNLPEQSAVLDMIERKGKESHGPVTR